MAIVESRSLLERAIRIDPKDAAAYSELGAVNESEGQPHLAHAAYLAARTIDATHEAASVGMTRVALRLGRVQEAIAVGEATRARGTVDAGLFRALGGAYLLLRNYRAAADAVEASLRIKPDADAFAYLAGAYSQLGQVDAAIASCDRALQLDPSHAEATFQLGIARVVQGYFPEGLAAFERAVELGSEEAHLNLGTLHLSVGNYREGWLHFGWATPTRRANPAYGSLPMWEGTSLPGQRLLVWHEQGVGDTIQIARFLRKAKALVGSVTLACPPEAVDLFRSIEGVDAACDMNEPVLLDSFDVWLPTVRLPGVFNVNEHSIAAEPYLRADAERIERFRPRLAAPGRLRVGLVWSGNPQFSGNAARSCGLQELESLKDVPGVAWFALQQGTPRAEQSRSAMRLIPINTEVANFADTAAIIAQLDLVITVDTSVAHLAGALGRPAWVILSHRPDWRWRATGAVSAWYPTLRLFRQSREGSWAEVIAAVATALRKATSDLEHRVPDSTTDI